MKIVREEIFGPVVVAEPFESLDEIAAKANDSPYGLGAGVWTRDISKAHAMAKRLRAGTVWINTITSTTLPCRSGVTSSRAGVVKWDTRCSRPTPKSSPSASSSSRAGFPMRHG